MPRPCIHAYIAAKLVTRLAQKAIRRLSHSLWEKYSTVNIFTPLYVYSIISKLYIPCHGSDKQQILTAYDGLEAGLGRYTLYII